MERYARCVFRDRARATRRSQDLDRPLRLVSVPAAASLVAVVAVMLVGGLWLFGGHVAVKAAAPGVLVNPPGNAPVVSPVSGVIAGPLTPVGTRVRPGDVVSQVRRADGSIEELTAPVTGTVVSLSSGAYAPVRAGETLLTIAPLTGPMTGVVFVQASAVGAVAPGLPAEVAPETVDVARTGVLLGAVVDVGPLPVSRDRLRRVLGDEALADEVLSDGPVHEVIVEFEADADEALGLKWSGSGPAGDEQVPSGTLAVAQLVLREQSPWQALLGIDADRPTSDPAAAPASGPTGPQALPVTGTLRVADQVVSLEVARTPEELETGLMFRRELPADRGMAFVFEEPTSTSFWMKDTLIPLDIVYVRDGVVTNIVDEAPPCESDPCPSYPSDGKIDTVVELAAGRAAELGIAVGSSLDLTYS